MIKIVDYEDDQEVIRVRYEGKTLCLGEWGSNGHTDFYAVVWDNGEQCLKAVRYATSWFDTTDNIAVVDASAETLEQATKWLFAWAVASWNAWNITQAKEVEKDKLVRVVGAGKLPIDTTGTVFWLGRDKWRREKAGLILEGGAKTFAFLEQLEVVDFEQYLIPDWVGRRLAYESVVNEEWSLPFVESPMTAMRRTAYPPPPLTSRRGDVGNGTNEIERISGKNN